MIIPDRLDDVLPDRAARHGDVCCLKSKASPRTYLASKARMNAAAASALPIIIKLLSWSLRRDAEKFAAPVRSKPPSIWQLFTFRGWRSA